MKVVDFQPKIRNLPDATGIKVVHSEVKFLREVSACLLQHLLQLWRDGDETRV